MTDLLHSMDDLFNFSKFSGTSVVISLDVTKTTAFRQKDTRNSHIDYFAVNMDCSRHTSHFQMKSYGLALKRCLPFVDEIICLN